MTLKELAHFAQHHLESRTGLTIRRSHVHELLAAAAGFRSWAAFDEMALLADQGTRGQAMENPALLAGRAAQLGFAQQEVPAVADALIELIRSRHLAFVRKEVLRDALAPAAPNRPRLPAPSSLLLDGLVRLAQHPQEAGFAQFALAALHRCACPNSYLYEESQKGRVLTAVEQQWVAEYLRDAPRFETYQMHLKEAARLGVRAAALECAQVLDSRDFYDLADRLDGPIDAMRMAGLAPDESRRTKWIRIAAGNGSREALEVLARQGDPEALVQLGTRGDIDALRDLLERAIEEGDAQLAWQWYELALLFGRDLTESTMRVYHDGGSHDGEFYDSDFGGPLYAAGDEGVELPSIDASAMRLAKAQARALFRQQTTET